MSNDPTTPTLDDDVEMTDEQMVEAQAAADAERRTRQFAEGRKWAIGSLFVSRTAEDQTDLPVPSVSGSWGLYQWEVPSDLDDEGKRLFALDWLRSMSKGLRIILRAAGVDPTLTKVSEFGRFGVKATADLDADQSPTGEPMRFTVEAMVDENLTCTYEPTDEVEVVPAVEAVPESTRPVMRKVCPPSVLGGVLDAFVAENEGTVQ